MSRMAGEAMRARGEPDHLAPDASAPVAPTSESSMIAQSAIDAELVGGIEIEVGRRLAALDMLVAAVDVVAERIGQAEMPRCVRIHRVELDEATALGRSGGSARTNSTAPATASIPSLERAAALRLAALVEFWRQRRADPLLDRVR